ncbi:c-type cytochrome [Ramlibacter alkalitolerans]|uniref:C-type cytochrome n=1 Tax=Ramlibacter alkalitolerans TaxID=2039631 RepID=A0ABS1JIX7_9BURK|nr:c-type cytochrome [Ramlibacter alkalitolerans]MBL0424178.1 c-type cytochrome [Ramlibacter alkalitolerans]
MSRRSEWGPVLRSLAAPLLLAGVAALSACGEAPGGARGAAPSQTPVAAAPAAAAPSEATLKLGRDVYNFRCYFCHGYSGDAKTLAATYMEPKPRNFQATNPQDLPIERIGAAVRNGIPNTAMKGFTGILNDEEMKAVSEFVRDEFLVKRAPNTRYHTPENGWPDHERNAAAFPFARGEIAIDTPFEQLTPPQQQGLRLFKSACITCHDHAKVNDPGKVWESRPVSFPRDAYCISCHQDVPRSEPTGVGHPQRQSTHTFAQRDGTVPVRSPARAEAQIGANYVVHDKPPALVGASAQELQGERLFQKNCAFCHAGDGTAKGWIGSFLEPHPRDLTSDEQMKGMTKERLLHSIREGLPNTSMPAWKSVMSDAEIEALAAYIARAFHPVAGIKTSQAK